jgi:hypothetical protein
MLANSTRENIQRDSERAVTTPNLTALSRHAALRIPLGDASLQRSPPPPLLTKNAVCGR